MHIDLNQMKAAPSILPNAAVLELTYRCNHQCLFCSCPWYAGMCPLGQELSTETWKQIIHEYTENGVTSFAFTGGEALLREDLPILLRYAAEQKTKKIVWNDEYSFSCQVEKPHVILLSNGELVTEDVLNLCKELDIYLSMSLPVITHFSILTGGTTAEYILERFKLAAQCHVSTTVAITVTSLNVDELEQTIEQAFEHGAQNLLLNRFLPGGRGLKHPELGLNRTQLASMLKIAERVLKKYGKRGHVGTEIPLCCLDPNGYAFLQVGSRCAAAKKFFVTAPSGYIRVCNHSPDELVFWKQWQTLKDHPLWNQFATSNYLPDECNGCSRNRECDAGRLLISFRKDMPDWTPVWFQLYPLPRNRIETRPSTNKSRRKISAPSIFQVSHFMESAV